MANHDVSNPTFSSALRKFETTDPGHADVFNPVIEQLINNDVSLNEQLSDMENQIPTNTDKTNWNNKVDKADYIRSPGYAIATGTSTAYAVSTNPSPTAYADGMQITIIPHVDCGANPTLNWNGLGAGTIVNQDGSAISAGDIVANKPLPLVRVGSNFFIRSNGVGIKDLRSSLLSNIALPTASALTNKQLATLLSLGMVNNFAFNYESINMPSSPLNIVNVPYGTKVYSLYTTASAPTTVKVQCYDTISKTWTQLAPTQAIPYGLSPFGIIKGTNIYFVDTGDGTMYCYSITLNTFSVVVTNINYNNAGVTTDGTYLYIAGGYTTSAKQLFTKYLPSGASTTLAALPIPMQNPKLIYSGGYIYAIDCGGSNLVGTGKMYKYNVATNTWTLMATVFVATGYEGVSCYGDYIYLTTTYNIWRYCISTGILKSMRINVVSIGFWNNPIIIGDYMYACSGYGNQTAYIRKFPITQMNPLIDYI